VYSDQSCYNNNSLVDHAVLLVGFSLPRRGRRSGSSRTRGARRGATRGTGTSGSSRGPASAGSRSRRRCTRWCKVGAPLSMGPCADSPSNCRSVACCLPTRHLIHTLPRLMPFPPSSSLPKWPLVTFSPAWLLVPFFPCVAFGSAFSMSGHQPMWPWQVRARGLWELQLPVPQSVYKRNEH